MTAERPVGHRGDARTALPLMMGLAALGAVSMNALLPSLGAVQAAFSASDRSVHLTLTAFLAGAAAAQLGFGAASDAYGRRSALLVAIGIFCIGSAVATSAPSIDVLAFGRLLQGAGGAACLILAEAMVADGSQREALSRRLGYLNVGMAVAILAAPLAGAALDRSFGWRSVLAGMLIAGVVLGITAWRRIADRPEPTDRIGGWFRRTSRLLRTRAFLAQCSCAGFVMTNYFCLVAFGPKIAMAYGLGSVHFAILFVWLGVGYVGGTLLAPTLYRRFGRRTSAIGVLLFAAAVAGSGVAAGQFGGIALSAFIGIATVMALAAGLVLPGLTSTALAVDASSAGAAAGLFNFAVFAKGAFVTQLAGTLFATTPLSMAVTMFIATTAALLISLRSA
ncbi:MAG: MFS transporter [Bauldia sp.]|nr:MFS transporter [Bauldia sp.]